MTRELKEHLAAEFDRVESIEEFAILCAELATEVSRLTHVIAEDFG